MTRKDYIQLASALSTVLAQASEGAQRHAVLDAAHAVARTLKHENPRFDYNRFMEAVQS